MDVDSPRQDRERPRSACTSSDARTSPGTGNRLVYLDRTPNEDLRRGLLSQGSRAVQQMEGEHVNLIISKLDSIGCIVDTRLTTEFIAKGGERAVSRILDDNGTLQKFKGVVGMQMGEAIAPINTRVDDINDSMTRMREELTASFERVAAEMAEKMHEEATASSERVASELAEFKKELTSVKVSVDALFELESKRVSQQVARKRTAEQRLETDLTRGVSPTTTVAATPSTSTPGSRATTSSTTAPAAGPSVGYS